MLCTDNNVTDAPVMETKLTEMSCYVMLKLKQFLIIAFMQNSTNLCI